MLSGFVASYSSAGSLIYVATMDGPNDDKAVHIAVDDYSNVYVAARLWPSVVLTDGLGVN